MRGSGNVSVDQGQIGTLSANNELGIVARDIDDGELQAKGAFAIFRDAMKVTAPFVRWIDEHATGDED